MKDYKKWTGAQRNKSLRLTKKAEELGLIKERCSCEICGQTEGTLDLHNTDYDVTLEFVPKMLDGTATQEEVDKVNSVLRVLCMRCHMNLHRLENNSDDKAANTYFKSVEEGVKYKPITRGKRKA